MESRFGGRCGNRPTDGHPSWPDRITPSTKMGANADNGDSVVETSALVEAEFMPAV